MNKRLAQPFNPQSDDVHHLHIAAAQAAGKPIKLKSANARRNFKVFYLEFLISEFLVFYIFRYTNI